MKQFEIKSLGLEEMTSREARQAEGGLIGIIVALAACALITGCTVVVNTGDGEVNVGDQKGSGTDVNTDVGVNV